MAQWPSAWARCDLPVPQRLAGTEGGAAQAQGELLLLAAGDLVLDQQGEELGVGEFSVEGLAVTRLERIEDAGQAQLLEVRDELGKRIHRVDSLRLVDRRRGDDTEERFGVTHKASATGIRRAALEGEQR